MKIKILSWGSKDWEYDINTYDLARITSKLSEVGLKYYGYDERYVVNDVIDKQLFFLMAIKYGIVFEEIIG